MSGVSDGEADVTVMRHFVLCVCACYGEQARLEREIDDRRGADGIIPFGEAGAGVAAVVAAVAVAGIEIDRMRCGCLRLV